jgi:pyruvate/2-oxoglutarate dehydrogenase complex dihydrolipoamide acyltransferase (E2) component
MAALPWKRKAVPVIPAGMPPQRHPLVLPDLDVDHVPATISLWLVDLGSEVTEGDRLVEVLAGGATIDLPSPATGRLVETLVGEDDTVTAGAVLGIIETEDST